MQLVERVTIEAPPEEREPPDPPTAQQKLRGAAARLEGVRYGAAREARDNWSKLALTLAVTVALSSLALIHPSYDKMLLATPSVCEQGTAAAAEQAVSAGVDASEAGTAATGNAEGEPETIVCVDELTRLQKAKELLNRGLIAPFVKTVTWVVERFKWVQLNVWLLFAFFAAPPALYLVEYFWLRRPLQEAERAALGLALKAPESLDPDEAVDRVEALVQEMNDSNRAVFDVIRGGGDA